MAQASGKNFNILGLPKRKELLSAAKRAVGKYAKPPLPKRKGTEPSVQIKKWKRVKMSESHTLARERGGSEREDGEERMDSTVKEGRLQEGKGG